MADHTDALAIVNDTQKQLAGLARAIVKALTDSKISPGEGMQLGMRGMTLAIGLYGVFESKDSTTRDDILWVLEHGSWTLDDV